LDAGVVGEVATKMKTTQQAQERAIAQPDIACILDFDFIVIDKSRL